MPNELPEKFIILGPDHPNREEVLCWSNQWGWVNFELASRFDERIMDAPLPVGSQAIIDMEEGIHYSVTPSGEGA